MFATINSPIHRQASLAISTGNRTPRANLQRSGTPYIAARPAPSFDVSFPHRLLKKIGSIFSPDACAALSAVALALSISVYTVAHISSHHQHAHHVAMTPIKSVETSAVDRSSILLVPVSGGSGNIYARVR
jgi:hypothetical protein